MSVTNQNYFYSFSRYNRIKLQELQSSGRRGIHKTMDMVCEFELPE